MLKLTDLTYRVGGRTLLDGASATVPDGHRVGLVGANGTGKTTLLRLIMGDLATDGGSIETGKRDSIGTVAQEEPDGAKTAIQTVLESHVELASLLAAVEEGGDRDDIGEIHARLFDLDGHRAEAKAAKILAGLGFSEAQQTAPLSTLSGGWRMRVSLGSALFCEPDILLLDEPTNHLDAESALWLENYLARYPRTLIIVSHDRAFLNRIPTAILHLDQCELTLYSGGYDRFERTRAEHQARQAAMAAKQEQERAHIQSFVDRFRYKASKARQAQSRLKMLERMQPITSMIDNYTVRFDLPKPEPLAPPMLTLDEVSAGYEADKPILTNLDIRIDMDDRIALLGANGNGKTTLLRVLAGRLKPQSGTMRCSSKLEVGYFAQNQMEELSGYRTALEELQSLEPKETEQKLRSHLGRFGFSRIKAETKIAGLSGGEKARLALAIICRRKPQLILLDEPTNHLDIDSRQALIQALAEFEGAVIVVSHDMHLVEATADRLLLVHDGTLNTFDGDVSEYRKQLLKQRRVKDDGKNASKSEVKEAAPKLSKQDRVAVREKISTLQKDTRRLERELEKLAAERARLDTALADTSRYENDSDALAKLVESSTAIDAAISSAEGAWLTAHEQLEGLGAETETAA